MHSYDARVTPKDLRLQLAEQRLVIDWKDGGRTEIPAATLRRNCPCATCKGERAAESGNPLPILKADPAKLRAVGAKLVGNYALQLVWSDGHDAGIYDFRFLRSLTP
jgi:DUF971 family protein